MIKVQGVVDTATLMEMSESAIDNRVYERKGQEFTVRQSLRLQIISGTTRFAEEVAKESGGAFFKLPNVDHLSNEELMAKFNEMHAKIGEWHAKFHSYTSDNEIDDSEKAEMEKVGESIHRTLEEMKAITFKLFCKDKVKA